MCHPHQVRWSSSESDGKRLSDAPHGLGVLLEGTEGFFGFFLASIKPSISFKEG